MVTSLRIITLNLCYECSTLKTKKSVITKLIKLLKKIKPIYAEVVDDISFSDHKFVMTDIRV